jgi:peptidoglycan/xylan/chitin deacetylase (PgdA/CDA1 family)
MITRPIKGMKFNKLRVSPEKFEAQVRHLKESGWYFASMSEITESTSLPEKTVVLTFDDGYLDNFLNAHPILKRYEAKATLYLVVNRHDNDWSINKKKHHDSGELMREPKLSDNDILEMVDSKIWELGGHTITHANLNKLGPIEKIKEVSGCKVYLEQRYNTPVVSFAYPFGIYTDTDVQIVKEAGYKSAVTTNNGTTTDLHNEIFELKRIKVSGHDSLSKFKASLEAGRRS